MDIPIYLLYTTILKHKFSVRKILKKWRNKSTPFDYSNPHTLHWRMYSEREGLEHYFNRLIVRLQQSSFPGFYSMIVHPIDHRDTISFITRYSTIATGVSVSDLAKAYGWHYFGRLRVLAEYIKYNIRFTGK